MLRSVRGEHNTPDRRNSEYKVTELYSEYEHGGMPRRCDCGIVAMSSVISDLVQI